MVTTRSTTDTTHVQGAIRTRVTKRTRTSKLGKHAVTQIKTALTPVVKKAITLDLPPSSPVSSHPVSRAASPPPTVVPLNAIAVTQETPPCSPAPPPVSAPPVIQDTTPPSSLTDRLSISYVPSGPLVGREKEHSALLSTLTKHTARGGPSGSLYICGLPGTGKTLTVTRVVQQLPVRKIWVNCANLAKPKDVFTRVADSLGLPESNDAHEAIRKFSASTGEKVVVVLDEVDFLTTRDQTVLYAAFEWARPQNARVVVVGVANALDLPSKLLPWLRASGCVPEVHTFAPYGTSALTAILKQRVGGEMSNAAVLMTAKKIAACAGDARAALDVAREAATDGAGGVAAVARIAATRGGSSNAVKTIRELPVVQQLALCAAANAALAGDKKRATLGGLHAGFTRLCQRAHVPPLPLAEFADMCTNALAHHALLDVPVAKGKRAPKTQRGRLVRLRVAVDDVRAGVADKGFLPFLVKDAML